MNIFSEDPIYKKRARLVAILWTLLILFLCFLPAREIPNVKIPLADKWVHFILFGGFAFLWLLSLKEYNIKHLLAVVIISVVFGWLVECIQGMLAFLGRNKDNMDIVADGIGGMLGVLLFWVLPKKGKKG